MQSGIRRISKTRTIIFSFLMWSSLVTVSQPVSNYFDYHRTITECEELIAARQFNTALHRLDSLLKTYDFIFLRDIKLATQLAIYQQNIEIGFDLIRLGLENGWSVREISKLPDIEPFKMQTQWRDIVDIEHQLHQKYLSRINNKLKAEVHRMFKRDQKMAIKALFRVGQKAKINYAESKFAPHSNQQLIKLDELLDQEGYPGEQLIGNDFWVSVILIHHNSISEKFNSEDTLYYELRPKLLKAIAMGQMSLQEFAIVEDWRIAVSTGHNSTKYGFLGKIKDEKELEKANFYRSQIGLRSIELRNTLIDLENELNISFYLPKDWQKDKILPESR